jgi:hypothetical protein
VRAEHAGEYRNQPLRLVPEDRVELVGYHCAESYRLIATACYPERPPTQLGATKAEPPRFGAGAGTTKITVLGGIRQRSASDFTLPVLIDVSEATAELDRLRPYRENVMRLLNGSGSS